MAYHDKRINGQIYNTTTGTSTSSSYPCPPADPNSKFYTVNGFCESDWCVDSQGNPLSNPHVDCACCPSEELPCEIIQHTEWCVKFQAAYPFGQNSPNMQGVITNSINFLGYTLTYDDAYALLLECCPSEEIPCEIITNEWCIKFHAAYPYGQNSAYMQGTINPFIIFMSSYGYTLTYDNAYALLLECCGPPTVPPPPKGYHHMPNGKLMSDAEHEKIYGSYDDVSEKTIKDKVIKHFNLSIDNISQKGETRKFSIKGDRDAVFSLEVKNEDGHYYNFSTQTFSATVARLKNISIKKKGYNGEIKFPAITDADHYDVYLFAEKAYNTVHVPHNEVRFLDGSLDINSSTGSNSTLMQKKIYQALDVTLTLSALSINESSDFTGLTVTNDTIIGDKFGRANKKTFSIPITARGAGALSISKQPITADIVSSVNKVMGTGLILENEDIWAGTVRSTDTTNGTVSSGTTVTMDTAVSSKMKVGDRVTGTGIPERSEVTVSSLHGTYTFITSEAVTIGDAVTLTFRPPHYYRFDMGSVSVHDLSAGNTPINPEFVVDSSVLANYKETLEIESQGKSSGKGPAPSEGGGPDEAITTTFTLVTSDAVVVTEGTSVITDGIVSSQKGKITFDKQHSKDIEGETVKFYARGESAINALNGYSVEFSNLKVTLTELTTQVDGVVSNSTTIGVDDRSGFMNNVTKIKGIGIAPDAVYPTITAGGGSDGSGNLTASAAQTLEDNIVLTLLGTGSVITITGEVEVKSFGSADATISFDIERFLIGS